MMFVCKTICEKELRAAPESNPLSSAISRLWIILDG